jgi:hypothetical protein
VVTEHYGLQRFYRLAGNCLLTLAGLWLLVTALLWTGNRQTAGSTPILSPVEARLAMPDQAYWDSLRNEQLAPASLELDAGRQVLAMGRGLVCLDEDGKVLWEGRQDTRTRLAHSTGRSLQLRSISSVSDGRQCLVTAWSEDGRQIWQRSVDIPADCIARVDDAGVLVLCAGPGELVRLDSSGNTMAGSLPLIDLRLTGELEDGRRFTVLGEHLACWSAMLEPLWDYSPQQARLLFAAGAGDRIICVDEQGRMHCLDSQGRLLWKNQLPGEITGAINGGYGSPEFEIRPDGKVTMLFFQSGYWMIVSELGEQLWQGRGYPYYGFQPDDSELFHEGPEGRRVFRAGENLIVCVDAQWRELWQRECSVSAEIIDARMQDLLVHQRSELLICLDWDGRELWQQSPVGQYNGIQSVLRSGGLTVYRTWHNQLVGIDNTGAEQFSRQLQDDDEFDLAADGRHIYTRSLNFQSGGGDWLSYSLLTALHMAQQQHVDCYDASGRRLWRARLPEGMTVDRLRHREDGALAVLASQDYSSGSYWGNMGEWEFVFRQPEG